MTVDDRSLFAGFTYIDVRKTRRHRVRTYLGEVFDTDLTAATNDPRRFEVGYDVVYAVVHR